MAKTSKLSAEEQVTEYFRQLDHPLKEVVQALREIVLNTDPEIAEQIKWNSPAYYFSGEMQPFNPKEYKRDIVVFNLHKKEFVLLVFPTGATINDQTGLLEGNFPDGRKTARFATLEEVKMKEPALKTVLTNWLNLVEK